MVLSTAEKIEDDSFDYLTVWQIVSKILCVLYSQLLMSYCNSLSVSVSASDSVSVSGGAAQFVENNGYQNDNSNSNDSNHNNNHNNHENNHNNHNNGRSSSSSSSSSCSSSSNSNNNNKNNNNNNTEDRTLTAVRTASKEYVLSTLSEYYSLLETVLDVLTVRVRYTNPKFLSEYLTSISAVIQSTSRTEGLPCVLPVMLSVCVLGKKVRKLKRKICALLLDIARQIRDSGEKKLLH